MIEYVPVTKPIPFVYHLLNRVCLFDLKNGPWLAGGAVLKLYKSDFDSYESDYDIWCSSEQQYNELVNRLVEINSNTVEVDTNYTASTVWHLKSKITQINIRVTNNTSTALTFDINSMFRVQVIKLYHSTLEELFDKFDLSICKLATDCSTIACDENTRLDISNNIMRVNKLDKNIDIGSRLVKYRLYGYKIDPELLQNIKQMPEFKWTRYEY